MKSNSIALTQILFILVLGACRTAEVSEVQRVSVSSVGASSSCDIPRTLIGCFQVVLAKSTRVYPTTDSIPNFDRDNCDFSGDTIESSKLVFSQWKKESEKSGLAGGKRKGCLQAFVAPEKPLMFKYFFTVRPISKGQISGTWEDVSLSSPGVSTYKDLSWRLEPTRENISSSGSCLPFDRTSGQYAFHLENGKANIIASYVNDRAQILKYFGDVVENVSCSN